MRSKLDGFVIHPNLFCAAVQKRGYVDLLELAREDNLSCNYGFTLPKDPACNLLCSWTAADPSTFLIRGETYLEDRKKVFFNIVVLMLLNYFIEIALGVEVERIHVLDFFYAPCYQLEYLLFSYSIIFFCRFQIKAKGTLMQMVAADWLRSDKREDDLAGRPGSIVQVLAIIS